MLKRYRIKRYRPRFKFKVFQLSIYLQATPWAATMGRILPRKIRTTTKMHAIAPSRITAPGGTSHATLLIWTVSTWAETTAAMLTGWTGVIGWDKSTPWNSPRWNWLVINKAYVEQVPFQANSQKCWSTHTLTSNHLQIKRPDYSCEKSANPHPRFHCYLKSTHQDVELMSV